MFDKFEVIIVSCVLRDGQDHHLLVILKIKIRSYKKCDLDLQPARSQKFAIGGGLFWKLETTANNLDPDFHQSSTRWSRFFCPNLGELQKKGLHWNWVCFSIQIQVVTTSNSSQNHISPWRILVPILMGGGYFWFLRTNWPQKCKKQGILHSPASPWLRYWSSRSRSDLEDQDRAHAAYRLLWVLMLMQLPALVFSVLVSKDFLCYWYLLMVCKKRVVFSIGCTRPANIP